MPQHQQSQRRDLSDLVRGTRVARRLSQEAVEAGTIDPETGEAAVTRSWLGRLERGEKVSVPDEPQLRGIARVLELPYQQVSDAAGAQFWAQQTVRSPSGKTRALIATAERLPPEVVNRMLALMEAFLPPESDGA